LEKLEEHREAEPLTGIFQGQCTLDLQDAITRRPPRPKPQHAPNPPGTGSAQPTLFAPLILLARESDTPAAEAA
jgi:hypothetical protein